VRPPRGVAAEVVDIFVNLDSPHAPVTSFVSFVDFRDKSKSITQATRQRLDWYFLKD